MTKPRHLPSAVGPHSKAAKLSSRRSARIAAANSNSTTDNKNSEKENSEFLKPDINPPYSPNFPIPDSSTDFPVSDRRNDNLSADENVQNDSINNIITQNNTHGLLDTQSFDELPNLSANNEFTDMFSASGTTEWTRNSNYSVHKLPATPTVLLEADFDNILSPSKKIISFQQFGEIDQSTQYAVVANKKSVYVWNYNAPDRLPVTMSFPLSQSHPDMRGPLALLIPPSAGSSEPGLVIILPSTGKATYWEAIGGAIADGLLQRKKGIEALIPISYSTTSFTGEYIECVKYFQPLGVLCSTSSGRFFLLDLRDAGGHPQLEVLPIRRSRLNNSIWSTLKSTLSINSNYRSIVDFKSVPSEFNDQVDGFNSTTPPSSIYSPLDSKPNWESAENKEINGLKEVVFATAAGAVSRWLIGKSANFQLLFSQDLKDLLVAAISDIYPYASKSFVLHDIEPLSFQIASKISQEATYSSPSKKDPMYPVGSDPESSRSVILLCSIYDTSGSSPRPYYFLFTVLLDLVDTRVLSVYRVTTPLPTSIRRPQILFPQPYDTVFLLFSHSVVLVNLFSQKESFSSLSTQPSLHKISSQSILARKLYRWEDSIQFKPDVFILSAGLENMIIKEKLNHSQQIIRNPGVVITTSNAGVLRIEKLSESEFNSNFMQQHLPYPSSDLSQIQYQSSDENESPDTHRTVLKSKIEQAIFYGFIHNNPLDFIASDNNTSSDNKGNWFTLIENIVLEISSEVLSSKSTYIPPVLLSVEDHLEYRCIALKNLAKYLNAQKLNFLSASTRVQLLSDLEICESAKNVWKLHNSWLNEQDSILKEVNSTSKSNGNNGNNDRSSSDIFYAAISELKYSDNRKVDDDIVRNWFFCNIHDLPFLLRESAAFFYSSQNFRQFSNIRYDNTIKQVIDVNSIFIEALTNGAYLTRSLYQKSLYNLSAEDLLTYFEPVSLTTGSKISTTNVGLWTSLPELIASLVEQFDLTKAVVSNLWQHKDEDSSSGFINAIQTLVSQLVLLSEALCRVHCERSNWCASVAKYLTDNESSDSYINFSKLIYKEGESISAQYLADRGGWILSLVELGKKPDAFRIAEQYRDYASLVQMCESEREDYGSESSYVNAGRKVDSKIIHYLEKYNYPFSKALFQYYIDTNQNYFLLHRFPDYSYYLDKFFTEKLRISANDHVRVSNIAWIQAVKESRYREASTILDEITVPKEKRANAKRFWLGVSKLATFVSLNTTNDSGEKEALMTLLQETNNKLQTADIQKLILVEAEKKIVSIDYNEQELLLDAKIDKVVEKLGTLVTKVGGKFLVNTLRSGLQDLFQDKVLSDEKLINVLTLLDSKSDLAGYQRHFFYALQVVNLSANLDRIKFEMEKIVWRRCILADNWDKIFETNSKSDTALLLEGEKFALYSTLYLSYASGLINDRSTIHVPRISEDLLIADSLLTDESLAIKYPDASQSELDMIREHLKNENNTLKDYINNRPLLSWIDSLSRIAKEESSKLTSPFHKEEDLSGVLKLSPINSESSFEMVTDEDVMECN